MPRLSLPKSTKLCSLTAIELLFNDSNSIGTIAYPLRAMWRENSRRVAGDNMQFMITVPKKKLHHAVDRVTMRRRVREAYRLIRHEYPLCGDSKIDIAFIYIAPKLTPYPSIERAMHRILSRVAASTLREPENANS